MAEALKVAGVLAGAGALVTSGVVIGRKTAPKVQGCALPEAPPRWPADIVTLQYLWLDIHRQGPGRYLVRDGDARWTLPRSFAAARIDLGGKTLEQDEWRDPRRGESPAQSAPSRSNLVGKSTRIAGGRRPRDMGPTRSRPAALPVQLESTRQWRTTPRSDPSAHAPTESLRTPPRFPIGHIRFPDHQCKCIARRADAE